MGKLAVRTPEMAANCAFPCPARICRNLRRCLSRGRPEERQELTNAIHLLIAKWKDLRGATSMFNCIDNM